MNASDKIDATIRSLAASGHHTADIGALLIAAGARLIEGHFGRPSAQAALASSLDALAELPRVHTTEH